MILVDLRDSARLFVHVGVIGFKLWLYLVVRDLAIDRRDLFQLIRFIRFVRRFKLVELGRSHGLSPHPY